MCVFQVKAKFTVDDHSHYLFTPCVLTQWVLSLLRYDLTGGENVNYRLSSLFITLGFITLGFGSMFSIREV